VRALFAEDAQRALAKIDERRAGRDWKNIPADFQHDAVRKLFEDMRHDFRATLDIKSRIKASQATTFDELRDAVVLSVEETNRKMCSIRAKSR